MSNMTEQEMKQVLAEMQQRHEERIKQIAEQYNVDIRELKQFM